MKNTDTGNKYSNAEQPRAGLVFIGQSSVVERAPTSSSTGMMSWYATHTLLSKIFGDTTDTEGML